MQRLLLSIFAVILVTACKAPGSAGAPSIRVVPASEVQWEQLNPARGDQSPQAGTLWGQRTGPGPAGFLLKPVDGFRSPPHIHSVDYQGVVIRGGIHNAHPDLPDQFLASGSFWTQPGGGLHITAARGDSLAYIEVDEAFDVRPAADASADGVRGAALLPADIAWSADEWESRGVSSTSGAEVAAIEPGSGNDSSDRGFIRLRSGLNGRIQTSGSSDSYLRVVVIQGSLSYRMPGSAQPLALKPGSYFGSTGDAVHSIECEADRRCLLYVRSAGSFEIRPPT